MKTAKPFKEGDKVVRIDALKDAWWITRCKEVNTNPLAAYEVESSGDYFLYLKDFDDGGRRLSTRRFMLTSGAPQVEHPKLKVGDYVVRTKAQGLSWINVCRARGWTEQCAHRVTGLDSTGDYIHINNSQYFFARQNFELANPDGSLVTESKQVAIDTSVRQPSHYQVFDGLESIEVIARSMTVSEFRGFCMGNVLKYRLRAGKKSELATMEKDLKKADFYKELFEQHKDKCHD